MEDVEGLSVDARDRLVLAAADPSGRSARLLFAGRYTAQLDSVPKQWYDLKGKLQQAAGESWRDTPTAALGGVSRSDLPVYQPAASF
ncbi:MAG: hypothetical protein HY319_15040 [Armatimonadetes bacterium]|nr:hypothetical protein [Armatimonadota bacterium]